MNRFFVPPMFAAAALLLPASASHAQDAPVAPPAAAQAAPAAPIDPKTFNPRTFDWRNATPEDRAAANVAMQTQMIDRILDAGQLTDVPTRDAARTYILAESAARNALLEQAQKLVQPVRNPAGQANDGQLGALVVDYQAAIEADAVRRKAAQDKFALAVDLDGQPRLKAVLLLMGLFDDAPSMVQLPNMGGAGGMGGGGRGGMGGMGGGMGGLLGRGGRGGGNGNANGNGGGNGNANGNANGRRGRRNRNGGANGNGGNGGNGGNAAPADGAQPADAPADGVQQQRTAAVGGARATATAHATGPGEHHVTTTVRAANDTDEDDGDEHEAEDND